MIKIQLILIKKLVKLSYVSALSNNGYLRILKALIIILFCFYGYVSNQNGKVLKEMLAGSRFCENNIEMSILFQNEPPPSFASSSKFSPILSQLLHTTDYYKWLCRLMRHIQIGRLPDQGTWFSDKICYMRVHVTYRSD